jgi:lipopolysaccharide transport protein LptA
VRRAGLGIVATALAAAFALTAGAAEPAPAARRIAVAPFEAEASPGEAMPDVAMALADRLGTLGAGRVIGPESLGAPAQAEPSPADVRAWAARAGVDEVVVGRARRAGERLSIEAHLRSGATGEVERSFIAEVPRSDALGEAVDRMASLVLGPVPLRNRPAAAGPPADEPRAETGSSPPRALFDLGWDSGKPLSIRADELEYVQGEGTRRLLFRHHVRVEQDGMTIESARLEALYPKKGSQPDRLVAEGEVRLAKGGRSARCDRAIYDRTRDVLTCEGHAEFQEGENRLSGESIEIDLAQDRMRVHGAAAVTLDAGLLGENARTLP